VDAGGLGGDEHRLANLPVRLALGDQGQHLGLTLGEAERGRLAKEREAQPRNPAVLAWAPVAAPSSLPVPGSPRSEASPSPADGVPCERVGPAARQRKRQPLVLARRRYLGR
jgi:hypothetical protein